MKVYLDACVLSGLVRNDISDEDLEALEAIVENPDIELVTSQKSIEEFERTPILRTKRNLKVLFKLIKKVYAPPIVTSYSGLFGDTPWGVPWGDGPGKIEHPTYSQLKVIFDPDDAEHLHFAKESGCDIFLTTDYRTIVRRYKQSHVKVDAVITPMKICDPESLKKLIE